jgi:hypothetical protein
MDLGCMRGAIMYVVMSFSLLQDDNHPMRVRFGVMSSQIDAQKLVSFWDKLIHSRVQDLAADPIGIIENFRAQDKNLWAQFQEMLGEDLVHLLQVMIV